MVFSLISVILLSGLAAIIFLVLTIMKKKKAWIGLVASIGAGFLAFVGLIMVALISIPTDTVTTASGTAEEVDESELEETEEEGVEEEPSEDVTELNVKVDETYEVNGLDIHIGTIEITEKDVVISLKAKNNSDSTKTFYPSQGDIIIGSKQLNSNFLMNKGDTWEDIHSGVEKSSTFKYVSDDEGLVPGEISETKRPPAKAGGF